MAGYDSNFWNGVQIRSVDPFRGHEADSVNRLTRILTLGNDCILQGGEVEIFTTSSVNIKPGKYIKDDVYIEFENDVVIDFNEPTNYVINDGGIWSTLYQTYYIVLEYTWAESEPPHTAKYKIAKRIEEVTDWHIVLAEATCQFNNVTQVMEIVSLSSGLRDNFVCNLARGSNGLEHFFDYEIDNDSDPLRTRLKIKDSLYYTHGSNRVHQKAESYTPYMNPVDNPGEHRYDLVYLDTTDNTIKILTGNIYGAAQNPITAIEDLPVGSLPLYICDIHFTMGAATKLEKSDVIDIRPFLVAPIIDYHVVDPNYVIDHSSDITFVIHNPPDSSFDILPGVIYIDPKTGKRPVKLLDGTTPDFQPVINAGFDRYDLLVANKDGHFEIVQGSELDPNIAGTDPLERCPDIPSDKLAFAIVHIDEIGNVEIVKEDITPIPEKLNKGAPGDIIPSDTLVIDKTSRLYVVFYGDPSGLCTDPSKVYVSSFVYVDPISGNRFKKFQGGESPSFQPIVSSGSYRYDLLCVNSSNQLVIHTGTEVSAPGDPYQLAPEIPYNETSIGIVEVSETGSVIVNKDKWVFAVEKINKSLPLSIYQDDNYTISDHSVDYKILLDPANHPDQVYVTEFTYISPISGQEFRHWEGGWSPSFQPLSGTGTDRYDILVIDDNEQLSIIQGIEQAPTSTDRPWDRVQLIPLDKTAICIIRIVQNSSVVIEKDHVTIANEKLNKAGSAASAVSFTKSDWDGLHNQWTLPIEIDLNRPICIVSDGVVMESGVDFTITGTSIIEFTQNPQQFTMFYGFPYIPPIDNKCINPKEETIVATIDGQDTFYLTTFVYAPNTNDIEVYLNGTRLPQSAFQEINSTTIKLNTPANSGDQIIIHKVGVGSINNTGSGNFQVSRTIEHYTGSDVDTNTGNLTLTNINFVMGINQIDVTLNGQKLYAVMDYEEVDNHTIKLLNYTPLSSDRITVEKLNVVEL